MSTHGRPRSRAGAPLRLIEFSPTFPVRNLPAALRHYERLGFTTFPYTDGDREGFAERDAVSIHLTTEPGVGTAVSYLYVNDADALAAEWFRPDVGGSTVLPEDTAYGLREGAHVDLDGNVIRFGSPLQDRYG